MPPPDRTPRFTKAEVWAVVFASGGSGASGGPGREFGYPGVQERIDRTLRMFGEFDNSDMREIFKGVAVDPPGGSAVFLLVLWMLALRQDLNQWAKHWQALLEDSLEM